jgi:cyclophilin family peptidyl-prolyl cis-trans isomerase
LIPKPADTSLRGTQTRMNPMRQLLTAMILVATLSAARAQDGIYADFTTSMGAFSIKLEFVKTPRTVANFVSLAEGSRPWVDSLNGAVKTGPYYEGVIFHRVIDGFMSQSGSRNGQGTDGPGYRFRDEIAPDLPHNRHVISMANSGVNTNGSQFFITDDATQHLDGLHTVFGSVVSGGVVVDAINAVPTGPNNRPLTPVVIQSVQIRRVGTAAQAFNVMAWDLPVVSGLPGTLEVTQGGPVHYDIQPDPNRTVTQAHVSLDLQEWSPFFFRRESGANVNLAQLDFGEADVPRAFFQVSQARYYDALPTSSAGKVLDVSFENNQRLIFTVNPDGQTGTCEYRVGTQINPTTIFETYTLVDLLTGDYRFNTAAFGGLRVDVAVQNHTPTLLTGSAQIYQFGQFTWNPVGTGTFTLTR